MPGLSDYAELKILDHSVNKAAWTAPTPWLALYTATPSDTGGGTEVSTSGTAYGRINLSTHNAGGTVFGSAAAGAITTIADITFATATGAGFGTVTSIGILDASTAGNLVWWGALGSSKAVGTGDVFKILTGQLTLTLD